MSEEFEPFDHLYKLIVDLQAQISAHTLVISYLIGFLATRKDVDLPELFDWIEGVQAYGKCTTLKDPPPALVELVKQLRQLSL